jgi:hypothetical protein
VEASWPAVRKSSKQLLLPRPFVQIWLLCEYCPRSIATREGQHTGLLAKLLPKVTPTFATNACSFGM